MWRPLLTRLEGLKLRLNCAPTRAHAQRVFQDFADSNPPDEEFELACVYYGWTIFQGGPMIEQPTKHAGGRT
jgi:hypothetical protein